MAVAKEYLFELDSRLTANFGKAIGHAARVEIIAALLDSPVVCYEELTARIPLDRSTINDHLRILQRCQLLAHGALPDGSAGYRLNREQYNVYRYAIKRVFGREGKLRQLPDNSSEVGHV